MRLVFVSLLSAFVGCVINFSLISPSLAETSHSVSGVYSQETQWQLSRLAALAEGVKSLYVDSVDEKKLYDDAMNGLLSGLDPHSSYLNEQDYRLISQDTHGEFAGIGIQIDQKHGAILVVAPLDDLPGKLAGIQSGDIIVRANQQSLRGISIDKAIHILRGKKGEPVDLVILRNGEKAPLKIRVVRDIVKVNSVKSRLIDFQYGYVRISQFQQNTGSELLKQIRKLSQEADTKLKGLVIDLRDNPGGLLKSAVDVTDTFLGSHHRDHNRLIVYSKGRMSKAEFSAKIQTKDYSGGLPVVLLVNHGSASASEIVAGALQDHKRALVVGTKTFGKGSVQTLFPFDDDKTAIKLTTARYYTPKGRSIQATGIEPDVLVRQFNIPKEVKPVSYHTESEADLLGHLAHGHDERNTGSQANATLADAEDLRLQQTIFDQEGVTSQNLMYSDYQLFEAMNILKGLIAINQSILKHNA